MICHLTAYIIKSNKRIVHNQIMRIVIQLVENYLKQDIPTILITTDNNKYLFNVPSSYQRFTKQHRTKMPVAAHYFFTRSNTATITGLSGLLLTLFERGDTCNTKLYLDDKLFKYMQELRYKMGMKIIPISYTSWSGKLRKGMNDHKNLLQLVQRQNFSDIFNNIDQFIQKSVPLKDQNNALLSYNPQTMTFKNQDFKISPFQITIDGQFITNYIIEPGALPGKMLANKLALFGIKGKAVAQIQRLGKLQINGKVVGLQDVKEPDSPSPNIIILHYNTLHSLNEIINHPRFRQYMENKNNFTYCVVHIIQDPQLIASKQFKSFLSQFADSVQHLIYNRKYRNSSDSLTDLVSLSSQVQLVSNLHQKFPLCMPNLRQQQFQYIQKFIGNTQSIDLMFPQKRVTAYRKCHQLVVSPRKSWGYKLIPGGQQKKPEFNQIEIPDTNAPLEQQMAAKFKQLDPKLVFLGTGSMKPSKYRNVSSIMVQWTAKDFIMFDCGQGSHIQVADHYGYQRYQQILLGLRTIFITHIHSDHNLGILDLISQRNKILRDRKLDRESHKLFLVLPANVFPWFNSFCQNLQNLQQGCDVIFIQSLRGETASFAGTMSKQNMLAARKCSARSEMVQQQEQQQLSQQQDQLTLIKPEWQEIIGNYNKKQSHILKSFETYLQTIGIVQFLPCPVIHCPQSFGIIIKHSSDVKISYSGDTRPCQQFAKAAQNSTILIHQATFGDDLASNAESHFHSTVGQAISIGMASKSWKTALTHFSQRYKSACDIVQPKMYKKDKIKQQYAEKHTIVCFDHFQMSLSKAHVMPYYSRALANAIPKDNKE